MNNRVLYGIIAVAFTGGLFSAVYAGPILPTITLAGDVDITGDMTCTECIDTVDIADDSIESGKILDGTIDGTDIDVTTAIGADSFSVGTDNTNDDDTIFFDDGTERIFWDDSNTLFAFTDDVLAFGSITTFEGFDIIVGDDLFVGRDDANDDTIFFGGVTEVFRWDESDLTFRLSDDLSTQGSITSASSITSGNDIIAGDDLFVGTDDGSDDDSIFFDDGTERIFWDDSASRFAFSDSVLVKDTLLVGTDNANDNDFILFDDGSEQIGWSESDTSFAFSNEVSVGGSITSIGSITSGASITSDISSDIIAGDDLFVGTDNANDDDTIFFDDGSETIFWDDSQSRFEFTDSLAIAGPLQAGSNTGATVPYHRFGNTGTSSHSVAINGIADVFIQSNLEVNQDIFADDDLRIGTDNGADDDFLCMDDTDPDGTCNEWLVWDDSQDRFELTDDLDVFGTVSPPAVAYTSENHDSIRQLAADFTGSDEVLQFWNTDTQRMEIYHLTKNKFYNFMGEEIPYQSNGIPQNSILNRAAEGGDIESSEEDASVEAEVELPEEFPKIQTESEGQ